MARIDRLEELLKREIVQVIHRQLDPVKVGFITVTKVEVDKDFSVAKVFYSQIGSDEDKKRTRSFLSTAAGYIKGEIGRVIRMKQIPRVRFIFDDTIEKAAALVARINEISKEDAER